MPDIYQHDTHKAADSGLMLRMPVDLCPPNTYPRLTNALPIIEGRLESRAGLLFMQAFGLSTSPGSGIHSIARLNQPGISSVTTRTIANDTLVGLLPVPNPTGASITNLADFSGDPVSLPQFHFNADTSAWQIIADRLQMMKARGSSAPGVVFAAPLGIAPPANGSINGQAIAAAGGAGNLNNGSGPGYDWVYTYVDTTTQTESNPSFADFPVDASGSLSPMMPDPGFGGSAGTTTGFNAVLTASSASETRQSALFTTAGLGGGPYQVLQLGINASAVVTGGGAGGCAYCAIYFSLNAGATWHLVFDANQSVNHGTGGTYASLQSQQFIINLNPGQNITNIQVRAVALAVGDTTDPQNVTARRIRQLGGNFNLSSLLTGGGGNAVMTLTVNSVYLLATALASTYATLPLSNQSANVCVVAPQENQVDAINLYRRGGSITASWAYVGQFPIASLTQGGCGGNMLQINDNVLDTSLGSFVTLTNDAPITSVYVTRRPLPYVWGPGLNPALLFGCGDPDRPDAVYFSNSLSADQWGSPNWIDVSSPSDPMQNGCILDSRVFAFSKEKMFQLTPPLVGTSVVTPFQTPCSRGLISPWGLWPRNSAACRAIYFVAKDGIYMTTGGPETSIVENDIKPLFPTLDSPGRQVESYDIVNLERIEDIRLGFYNDELYFIYRGQVTGQLQMLLYDQNKQRWRAATFPVAVVNAYSEEAGPASSLLLGDATGNLYTVATGADTLNGSTSPIAVNIRTGAFDQGMQLNPKEYGSAVFDIDPGGATLASPVTITPLLNGETITDAAITITGTGRQSFPLPLGDAYARNIEFDITWSRTAAINPVLYQLDILYRPDPIPLIHSEVRESSYGMQGYFHCRDAYIGLRSTVSVTLTMTFDGTSQTYTLPSTAGNRRKVYIPFSSNKGKVYRFQFDAVDGQTPFQIYAVDTELRIKQFMTSLGYQTIRAFGEESTAVTSAFQSSLLTGGKG